MSARSGPELPPELVDAIDEAVTAPASPAERAAVIVGVAEEISEAVEWRAPPQSDDSEQSSVEQIVDEARGHQARMEMAGEQPPSPDTVGAASE